METNRIQILIFAVLLIAVTFTAKLYHIQVFDESFKEEANKNIRQRIRDTPRRGLIYDRYGKLVVANENIYDLYVVPREFKIKDTSEFCERFGLTRKEFLEKFNAKKKDKLEWYIPIPFIKEMTADAFAAVQDYLSEYPGLSYKVRTIRRYEKPLLANILGYVKEIDKNMLEAKMRRGEDYESGDLIGKTGIEATYENELRGKPGSRYVMLNVRRIEKGSYMNGQFDTLPEIGNNLQTGIDIDLQEYGEILMNGKIGSIVAIEPATGEILSMVSGPTYNPDLLTGRGKKITANYQSLLNDENKPLFNRAVMSLYPPGSTIKTVQALIGLQINAFHTAYTYPCIQNIVKCHGHPSPLDVYRSIQYSCNPYYVHVFRRIITQNLAESHENTRKGLQQWHDYMNQFGLGKELQTDLFGEKAGLIPVPEYYDKKYGEKRWGPSNIYSLGIGQGEMGITPLQMANVSAIIANRGWYYIPHVVKKVDGDPNKIHQRFREKKRIKIDSAWFNLVANSMQDVVKAGTARMAIIPDIEVCGKTGTAQNPHGEDHSVFIAFAPKDNPKIAIAVYVENAGFGGVWAAPIASLMIEKYLTDTIKRKHLEDYVLKRNFIEEQRIKNERKLILKLTNTEGKPVQPNQNSENQTSTSLPSPAINTETRKASKAQGMER